MRMIRNVGTGNQTHSEMKDQNVRAITNVLLEN